MVFSSINPVVFLDPPPPQPQPNWQQQHPDQLLGGGDDRQALQLPPLPPASVGGQSRPGSMADRARVAKIPQPEAALKCPRCESTNTKFCYYNNYSLSQPRHFCKTCRRYWTWGGALRNVPVGGGCRRNKRSKSRGGSKSQAVAVAAAAAATGPSSTVTTGVAMPPPVPFLLPLHGLTEFGDLEFQLGTANGGINGTQTMAPNGLLLGEPWRMQQFPFLTNLGTTPPGGLFQFGQNGEGMNVANQGMNLFSGNLLGLSGNYDHQPSWNGNNTSTWTDVLGLTSSSITSHQQ